MERTLAKLYDIKKLKLGKKPAHADMRILDMGRYLKKDLPPPPPSVDWSLPIKLPWGMLKNDALGDCTAAGCGHLIQVWTACNGMEAVITDDQTVAFYSATCGYNPADANTDQGGIELDVLKWWQGNSFGGQYKIESFAFVDPKQPAMIKASLYLMGGLYIGLRLPLSAQDQPVWDVPPGGPNGNGEPDSWGGHAVALIAYDDKGLTCVTWGQPWKMTWAFFAAYCDEAYAILSPLWYGGHAPSGVDLPTLQADMANLQGQPQPVETPPTPPAAPAPATPIPAPAPAPASPALPPEFDPLAQFTLGKITVSISQSFVNLVLLIAGSVLVSSGKFELNSVLTWIGAAATLIGGAAHLRNIHNSNMTTVDYVTQVMRIISLLRGKV